MIKALRGIVIPRRHSHVEGVTLHPPALTGDAHAASDPCRPGRKKTMSQTYQPGQIVRLLQAGLSKRDASANDLYEVIRLMPADQNGEIAYRVKSLNAGERAVREGEIIAYISED